MADIENSMPMKVGGAVVAGGSILGILYMLRDSAPAIGIILIGIVLVGVLLVLYGKFRAMKQAGKDKQMSGDVRREAASTPQSVNSAESRAKLDDMRRKFQEGLDKFRSTGKSLYTMPWYLVVGESGSGKTEAIRRSQVPCPAGFQDPLQGAGGTVNMNWWFTNYGVILDTAGRLMLPEVPAANNPEWDEFLTLLNRRRPNCPINGLILVIPADTLLTATSEKIEKTAGEVAYQFDKVQRTLGIRFPVFVLITKCDKINGFRQFFENTNSPDEMAQMLGWSNPTPLDQPFNTALVDNYIGEVRGRLLKRRMRLLADPINTEDPNGRRLDEVDALYQFPDALQSIAPRLRRYLEPIFVAGTWTAKPLFLRGIYFTSSLQTGEAVDKAISDILGVDVKATLGGPVVSEKSYFLRDAFMEKVFKERGLVTRASDIDKMKRRRKLVVIFTAFLAVLGLGGFTWYGQQKLKEGIGQHLSFWDAIANTDPKALDIVNPTSAQYQGRNILAGDDKSSQIPLITMYQEAPAKVEQKIEVPMIFKPMAAIGTDMGSARLSAYRTTFETHVIAPLITKARLKMTHQDKNDWDSHATSALRQLILIEARQPVDPVLQAKEGAPLDPLFYYVLVDGKADDTHPDAQKEKEKEYLKYADPGVKDRKILQDAYAWTFSTGGGNDKWPGATVGVGNTESANAIDNGIEDFIAWSKGRMKGISDTREAVKKVGESLGRFQIAEKSLIDIDRLPPSTTKVTDAFAKDWQQKWGALLGAKDALDATLNAEVLKGWSTGSLSQYYQQRVNDVVEQGKQSYDDLLKAIPAGSMADDATVLGRARTNLTRAKTAAEGLQQQVASDDASKSLSGIEDIFLTPTKKPKERKYEVHFALLNLGNSMLPKNGISAPPSAPASFKLAMDGVDQALDEARNQVSLRQRDFEKERPIQEDCDVALYVIDLSGRVQRASLLEVFLVKPLMTADAWGAEIAKGAGPGNRPKLPLAPLLDPKQLAFNPVFDPSASSAVTKAWNEINQYFKFTDPSVSADTNKTLVDFKNYREKHAAFQKALDQYSDDYLKYWKSGVLENLTIIFDPKLTWTNVQPQLVGISAATVDSNLKDLATQRLAALTREGLTPAQTADASRVVLQLRSELDLLGSKGIDAAFQQRMDAWKLLNPKPDVTRETLLDSNWDKFLNDFLKEPADTVNATFTEKYWADVCFSGLYGVSEETQFLGDKAWAELMKSYKRFPLAVPREKEIELTKQQLGLVQQKLRDVTGKLHHVTSAAGGPPTLATVQQPSPVRVAEAVRALRGVEKFTVEDKAWIAQCQSLLDILVPPGPGCKFSVTLRGPTDELRQKQFYLRLDQGPQIGVFGDLGTKDANTVIARGLTCPGTKIKFVAASDAAKKQLADILVVPSDEWGGLRLLADGGVKNTGVPLQKWDAKLMMDGSPVPVTIEFDQALSLPFLPQ